MTVKTRLKSFLTRRMSMGDIPHVVLAWQTRHAIALASIDESVETRVARYVRKMGVNRKGKAKTG